MDERATIIVTMRDSLGMEFGQIGAFHGITKQRAFQIYQRAVAGTFICAGCGREFQRVGKPYYQSGIVAARICKWCHNRQGRAG